MSPQIRAAFLRIAYEYLLGRAKPGHAVRA